MDFAILSVSGLSAFFDCKFRRIPNWLILFGAACGVTLNALQSAGLLVQSLLGFIVGVAVLLVPFAMGWIGAGDVKFFGVAGSLLGVSWLPRVFFYSAIAAGVIAVVYLAVGGGRFTLFKQTVADLKIAVLSMGQVLPEPVQKRSKEQGSVPWGVAFAVGMIIAYYIDPSGQFAGF